MRFHLPFLGLALPGALADSPLNHDGCSEVTFEVPTTSENVRFHTPPAADDTATMLDLMRQTWQGKPPPTNGTTTVSGTWTISGTYCVPSHVQTPTTLEVLIHGITYNKDIWAGLGFDPALYSWHAHANARGYATLALDRLGHGANPQRPDPLSVVQPQLQLDIIHQILAAARTSPSSDDTTTTTTTTTTTDPAQSSIRTVLRRQYTRVVYVGHSWGSYLGAALAAQYPTDADALVLTGYSAHLDFSRMVAAEWVSAATLPDPSRFGGEEGLAPGYFTLPDAGQRRGAFFWEGGFDERIAEADFEREDTLTPGEILALGAILGPVVGYRGAVLVVTPVQDVMFCEEPAERCEAHLAATQGVFFPDVERYDYFAPENTGHDLTLHYTAGETFGRVHDWLDGLVEGGEEAKAAHDEL